MFRLTFVRGHYYRGDREIENISEEGQAMVMDKPCVFCSTPSSAMLLIADPEEEKAYAMPACKCIQERLPDNKDEEAPFLEELKKLSLADVPFFRLKPAPVLRINASPLAVQKNLGTLLPTDGRLVDCSEAEILQFESHGFTITLFPAQQQALMTRQNSEWMDDVVIHGRMDYPDSGKIIEHITTNTDHADWARELVFWRLQGAAAKARVPKLDIASMLVDMIRGRQVGPDPDCDCEECTAARAAADTETEDSDD